ncbi:MAG: class II aldolase/adducin family protein [Gracilibacteraceae bacterium]|jgi:L-fuculose-phosphate aldolase|nr:class II aldolase/adducin family protein [Gracilibacteraceae bacterium]
MSETLRQTIVEIGRRLYARRLIAAYDGNISCRADDAAVWTTPTGVCKGFLTEDMLVGMDLTGRVTAGDRRPSSETGLHLGIYRENPAVRAVVHAHPPAATALACMGRALDRPILPEVLLTLGPVPLAPYAIPGSPAVAESVAPYCRTHNGALLANHGAVTWGGDLWEAYYRMEKLEHFAEVLLRIEAAGGRAREIDGNTAPRPVVS